MKRIKLIRLMNFVLTLAVVVLNTSGTAKSSDVIDEPPQEVTEKFGITEESDPPEMPEEFEGTEAGDPPEVTEEPEGTEEPESPEAPENGNGDGFPGETEPLPSREEPDEEIIEEMPPDIGSVQVLSETEAVVKNFADLKTALQGNNGITTVYFGADIQGLTGGISISASKSSVTISGIDPTNPNQEAPYTYSDYSSNVLYNSIYVDFNNSTTKNITLQDMSIIGHNFYGPVAVYDIAATNGVTITYERINYSGPQLVHNRNNTAHFTDCSINIHGKNGGSVGQEVGEASRFIFEGNNTVVSEISAYSMFWFPSSNHLFELLPNASLSCVRTTSSAAFQTLYSGGQQVTMRIGEGARFSVTAPNGLLQNATFKSFEVGANAAFEMIVNGSPLTDLIPVNGPLTLMEHSSFAVTAKGTAAYPVLDQSGGNITVGRNAAFHIISQSSNSSLVQLDDVSFICNDPASVLLYNNNRPIASYLRAGSIIWTGQQINYWEWLSAGGLGASTFFRWVKADPEKNIEISGSIAIGASGNIGTVTSNYENGDNPPWTPPDSSNFNMVNARVLSIGRLDVDVNAVTTHSRSVHGVTAPGATARVRFISDTGSLILADVQADSQGFYIAEIPSEYALDTSMTVNVSVSSRYLYAEKSVPVTEVGVLEFFVPPEINFMTTQLSPHDRIVGRVDEGWEIVVSDSRGAGGDWTLRARLKVPLTPATEGRPPLEDAMIFVSDSGVKTLRTGEWVVIRQNDASGDEVVFVNWPAAEGLLARIPGGMAYSEVYSGVVEWELVDAP